MDRYDVAVVGAGPAGIAAAIYASEGGAKTLLIDKSGFAGGMSTDGMLNVFCGTASGGLFREIHDTLTVKKGTHTVYDVEELREFYFNKLSNSGVRLLFHATFSDVELSGDVIDSINLQTANGSINIKAKYFIDATGDGNLAAAAGCPHYLGRETDGKMQPCTLMVRLGGVDDNKAIYPKFSTHPLYQELLRQAVQRGEVPMPAGHIIIIPEKNSGMVNLNMTNSIGINGTDAWDRTRAEIICRSQVQPLLRFIRQHLPGYENAFVLQVGQYTGVRESRHFEGEYVLNETDIKEGRVFDDWCVTHARYLFGIHNMNGSGVDKTNAPADKEYTIPYRSLLPKKVSNLLLSGRCISGTHMAHSSYRVMPICMGTGQAAGTAAALAVKDNKPLCEIDINKLQNILISQGMEKPNL